MFFCFTRIIPVTPNLLLMYFKVIIFDDLIIAEKSEMFINEF